MEEAFELGGAQRQNERPSIFDVYAQNATKSLLKPAIHEILKVCETSCDNLSES